MDPKRIEAALQPHYSATVARPSDPLYVLATGFYRAASDAQPSAMRALTSVALSSIEDLIAHASITFASLIVLSPADVADATTECVALAHQFQHRSTAIRDGFLQSVTDYTSGELRAQREAGASAAGLWLRYVLTGDLPADAPTLGDLYHLDAGDAAMARQIIAAHLATIRAGVVPNLDVCVVLARWFHAQTDIPADVLARVAVVP